MKRFSCQRCGACCNNIQGNFKDNEIKEIKRIFGGLEKEGIYLAVEPERFSIPLFPHEVRRMKELASQLNIEFHPVPKLFMIDSKTGYCIVLEWDLGYSNCPFFEGNSCLIHGDRPLACRCFPVFPFSFSSHPQEYFLLGRCPQSERYEGMNRKEKERFFEEEVKAVSLYLKELKRYREMKDFLIGKGLLVPLILEREKVAIKKSKKCMSIDELYDNLKP